MRGAIRAESQGGGHENQKEVVDARVGTTGSPGTKGVKQAVVSVHHFARHQLAMAASCWDDQVPPCQLVSQKAL